VLASNILGALLVAWFAGTAAFKPEFRAAFVELGRHATSGSAEQIFLSAVPAGWLIALIVWLGPAAPSARLWIVLIIAYVVGSGEFAHVIAGSDADLVRRRTVRDADVRWRWLRSGRCI